MDHGSISVTKDDLEQAYRTHDSLHAGHQTAAAVVVGPEGITVLASQNPAGESEHTWILRLNLDGVVAWERHYDPKYGSGRAITRLAQGGFVVAGEIQRSPTEYQASLLHIDAAGEIVGAVALGPRGGTGFNAVQVRPDGTVLAGGSSGWKGWLVTTDPTLRSSAERTVAVDEIESLRLLPSGDAAVLGIIERSTTTFGRSQLAAVASSGQVRWQRQLPTSGRGDPAALVVRQDGALAVGSGAADEHALAHIWLAHCDATGTVTWQRTIAATSGNARAWTAVGLADGYAIVGETATAIDERMPHVWRLGDDGTPRWDQPYRGSGSGKALEIVNGIDATSDGGLVLAGSTTRGAGKTNVWIVRLAADGKVIWQRVFGSPATGPS